MAPLIYVVAWSIEFVCVCDFGFATSEFEFAASITYSDLSVFMTFTDWFVACVMRLIQGSRQHSSYHERYDHSVEFDLCLYLTMPYF